MTDQAETRLTREILKALSEPFREQAVSWKPQRVSGGRALAVAYIDARDVQNRLDETVGGDWEYYWSPDGQDVHGSLTVCGVTREDVGEIGSGQMGGTRKAAVSDALKRCGVHFGVGRYLYQLPAEWVDYDDQTKRIVTPPRLPSWAVPTGSNKGDPEPMRQAPTPRSTPAAGPPPPEDFGPEPEEYEQSTASQPEQALPTKLEELRGHIRSKVNEAYTRPATEKQAGSVASCLDELFPGNDQQMRATYRHGFTAFVFGVESTKDLNSGQASALIDWAIVGKDDSGKTDWAPRQQAITWAAKWLENESKGQARMGGLDYDPYAEQDILAS